MCNVDIWRTLHSAIIYNSYSCMDNSNYIWILYIYECSNLIYENKGPQHIADWDYTQLCAVYSHTLSSWYDYYIIPKKNNDQDNQPKMSKIIIKKDIGDRNLMGTENPAWFNVLCVICYRIQSHLQYEENTWYQLWPSEEPYWFCWTW